MTPIIKCLNLAVFAMMINDKHFIFFRLIIDSLCSYKSGLLPLLSSNKITIFYNEKLILNNKLHIVQHTSSVFTLVQVLYNISTCWGLRVDHQ